MLRERLRTPAQNSRDQFRPTASHAKGGRRPRKSASENQWTHQRCRFGEDEIVPSFGRQKPAARYREAAKRKRRSRAWKAIVAEAKRFRAKARCLRPECPLQRGKNSE